ncbi:DUF192 domain-containing protein [Candidatus Falkowbacteria bacterium]|nr:DUF192 domain-containing protein [Candidatus Falkowbacteria bacterium]
MKNLRLATILSLVFILSGCASSKQGSGMPYLTVGGKTVEIELARTSAERIKGLSGHAPLKQNQGMLFVFNEYTPRTFWMKDMLFPLDIIWIKDDTVTKISPDLPPEGSNPQKLYESGEAVNYVLEVSAGWAQMNKIKAGDKVSYHYDQ